MFESREWTPGCLVKCIRGHNVGTIGIMLELSFYGRSGSLDSMDVLTGENLICVLSGYILYLVFGPRYLLSGWKTSNN